MMTGPNMATITASLQNCSLSNHHQRGGTSRNSAAGIAPPDGISDSSGNINTNFNNNNNPSNDATVELNSEIALPYHWEQCLDLKTGEIYYLNWRTGMRVSEDPRTNVVAEDQVYSEEDDEDDEDDDDDNNSYDSEETYSEELPSLSSSRAENTVPQINILTTEALRRAAPPSVLAAPTLVLGGCKACLMYFMVPKEVEECPRCGRQLLHFDDQN